MTISILENHLSRETEKCGDQYITMYLIQGVTKYIHRLSECQTNFNSQILFSKYSII